MILIAALAIASILVTPLAAHSAQDHIIPPRPIGIKYGQPINDVLVRIQFYIDLLCPDSWQAWPRVLEIADLYRARGLELNVHLLPLPYHQNSFYAVKATYVVHVLTQGKKTFDWIRTILNGSSNLTDLAFHEKSDADLLLHLRGIAESLGVNGTEFVSLTDRRTRNVYETLARASFNHAAAKGVHATPTFFVNDMIQSTIDQSWSRDQWSAFLSPLLQDSILDSVGGTSRPTVKAPVVG